MKKIWARDIEKIEGKFFCFGTQTLEKFAGGSGAELKIGIWIFVKKSSNFVQQTQPNFVFSVFGDCGLGAKRRRIEIRQDFPSVFEIEKESAVGNLKVRFAEGKMN